VSTGRPSTGWLTWEEEEEEDEEVEDEEDGTVVIREWCKSIRVM
jgi:hypothetical protein